ncbi:uncharacterized protein LOC143767895 [Ranitomeya variabilis]|uniref:uncharacterized protein LOC143767895 n=1 Tax=Ranitomeya variabilis TaxID=490064 RepID=UPI004056D979
MTTVLSNVQNDLIESLLPCHCSGRCYDLMAQHQGPISQGKAAAGQEWVSRKRKYIYYDRLSFLDPSMDLRPTQSNLTERETGSDSEVVIDPVGVEEEVAGPSLASSSSILHGPSTSASQDPATSGQDAAPPPTAAPDRVSQEEHGHSSSPTVPLVSSPQAAGPLRRGRRRRELQESRRNVDAGVLNYLARAATDDGEEAFARSLARYLRPLPREVRLRVRGCIQILIDLCTFPNDPYEVLEFIERRQLSPHNLLSLPRNQQVHGQSGFEAPPPCVPTPQPLPSQNPPRPAPYHMAAYNQPSQYGNLSRPSALVWSQPGFGRHGHIGGGYDSREYFQQHEGQSQISYGQYPSQYDQGLYLDPPHTASTQGEGQLGQQRPPEHDPELPPSSSPTYRNL